MSLCVWQHYNPDGYLTISFPHLLEIATLTPSHPHSSQADAAAHPEVVEAWDEAD